MKAKGIFTCAALAVGLFALNVPLSAAVESDIVGYTTLSMEAGKWYQIGVVFDSLDGTQAINQVFSQGFGEGDELYIYDNDAARYTFIRMWKDGPKGQGWYEGDVSNELATDLLKSGQGVFIKKAVAGEVVLCGAVNEVSTATFGSESGPAFGMIAYPYPTPITLNQATWTNMSTGDKLHIFDNATSQYVAIRYWKTGEQGPGWYTGDVSNDLAEDIIQPGQGFFVSRASSGKSTLSK